MTSAACGKGLWGSYWVPLSPSPWPVACSQDPHTQCRVRDRASYGQCAHRVLLTTVWYSLEYPEGHTGRVLMHDAREVLGSGCDRKGGQEGDGAEGEAANHRLGPLAQSCAHCVTVKFGFVFLISQLVDDGDTSPQGCRGRSRKLTYVDVLYMLYKHK